MMEEDEESGLCSAGIRVAAALPDTEGGRAEPAHGPPATRLAGTGQIYSRNYPSSDDVPQPMDIVAPSALPKVRNVQGERDAAHAQLIGSSARTIERTTSAQSPSNRRRPVPAKSSSVGASTESVLKSRIFVPVLAMVALGACLLTASHVHAEFKANEMQGELERLKERNALLEQRAQAAQREHQDLARLVLDPSSKKRLINMMERSEAFDSFIKQNGFESRVDNTVSVRSCIGQAVREFNISSLLDVPCGDASWQHQIPGIKNLTYIGADISFSALEKAKTLTANIDNNMEFMLFDAVHFPLKRSFDLILFRDVIEQQQIHDTLLAILNFKESGSQFLAATYWPSSPAAVNQAGYNLNHADWYESNLLLPPFNFPSPLFSCENDDAGPHHGRARLGFWRLKDLSITPESLQRAAPLEKHVPSTATTPQQASPQKQANGQYVQSRSSDTVEFIDTDGDRNTFKLEGGEINYYANGEKYFSNMTKLKAKGHTLHIGNYEATIPPEQYESVVNGLMAMFQRRKEGGSRPNAVKKVEGVHVAPQRQRQVIRVPVQDWHQMQMQHPFHDFFDNFLETRGPVVRHQLPNGQIVHTQGMPSNMFQLPMFTPFGPSFPGFPGEMVNAVPSQAVENAVPSQTVVNAVPSQAVPAVNGVPVVNGDTSEAAHVPSNANSVQSGLVNPVQSGQASTPDHEQLER